MAFKLKRTKSMIAVLLVLCLFAGLSGCTEPEEPVRTVDPYEGLVQVADGTGSRMWVKLHEELAPSPLEAAYFADNGNYIDYTGSRAITMRGIDVSFYQGEIDWPLVAEDGIEFAMIRAGYRGYSVGAIVEDEQFRNNIDGAVANGIKVGVYFFSQAVNEREAKEEAEFVLELLEGYELDLPVMFDWERVHGVDGGARTDDVTGEELTDCCIAFCETIAAAGYEAGVYFYRDLGYNQYELNRLEGLSFWVGALGDYPDFYYKHDIWQYSITGEVAGIEGDVDLNIAFVKTIGVK